MAERLEKDKHIERKHRCYLGVGYLGK